MSKILHQKIKPPKKSKTEDIEYVKQVEKETMEELEKSRPEEWEKKFDDKFVISKDHFSGELKKLNGNALWTYYIQNPGMQELKSFISSLLQVEREKVIGEVEKLKRQQGNIIFKNVDDAFNKVLAILKGRK